jgi:hypothetical protein
MEVEVDTNTIFSAPLESLNDISMPEKVRHGCQNDQRSMILLPTGPGEERFTWPSVNGPVGNWDPNPV